MTSTAESALGAAPPTRRPFSPAPTSGASRLRQGAILLVGAIIITVVIGASPTGFYWTPLSVGLVYLAAALSGGARGSYWASALVLIGWGAAVVIVSEANPNLDTSGLYLAGAGVGASVGMLLARRGFAVAPLGLTATIAVAGALLAVEGHFSSVLGDARFYALFLGVTGVVNLVVGAFAGDGVSDRARDPASG